MANPTPGPWRVGYSDETEAEALEHDTIVVTRVTNKLIPEEICEVAVPFLSEMPDDGSAPIERALADARLIAAAPDLLAALVAMNALAEGPPAGVTVAMKREVITNARAAIRKATGSEVAA